MNKDLLISPEDFNTFVPKKRQKSSMVENTKGVLVQRPDHLSTFTVDRDKIDYFKQAQVIKDKIQKSSKIRDLQLKEKKKEIAKKVEEKQV